MGIQVNQLTNANVYLNGASLLGRAEEVDLPDIKNTMADHKALGMVGKLELPNGIDKLEASFKWNAFYRDVAILAANPFRSVAVQVRGSLETWDGSGRTAQVPAVVFMTGTFKEFGAGKHKQHENAEYPNKMAVTYIKCVVNGEVIYEIDVMNNIYTVAGEDLMAAYRANIGG
ncbi:MAG: phage major tail tube protein [Desulfovibrionaceae bacterium]|nr:phage major tail tube protein [Desulfovibrionaceae bacterium]MBF0513627.1 phage major tail tube protein [Desulfovibrionaceae bacterium]